MVNLQKIFLTTLLFGWALQVSADPWGLPIELNDQNTKVKFEVDSTWHMIHGVTSGVSGSIKLADPKNPTSVKGEIAVPVARFDTDNSSRDEELREVMDEVNHKLVQFKIEELETLCDPEAPKDDCPVSLTGKIQIRGVTKPIKFVGSINLKNDQYILNLKSSLKWRDYNVEDPSIFVARLYEDVAIEVNSTWNKTISVK